MSWPSMTMACQPNARQRRANCSMSCCHIVGRLWPRPLTSVMPHRLSSLSMRGDVGRFPHRAFGRLAVAEQHVGAVVGLDAARVQRDADRRRRCPGRAIRWRRRRTAAAASDGLRDRSRSRRSFSSSARSNAPASAHAAYRIGAACPFDSTKRSLSGLLRIAAGRSASRRRTARPSMSAAEQQLVGWPLPASDVARIESMRSRVAMFLQRGNRARRDQWS